MSWRSRQRNREMDKSHEWMQRGGFPSPGTPCIESQYRGMTVILKPRGWEVDGTGSTINGCELLSEFVQACFIRLDHPLVYLSEFDHGFIHRLDIPSSGLILTGISFEGLYWIRWQLNVYHISREYYVMSEGLVHAEICQIDTPIDVRTNRLGSHRSITGDQGGPARTSLRALCNMSKSVEGLSSQYTSVGISIRTGRKHQIRTHLRSIGHASIVDGMYGVLSVFAISRRVTGHGARDG